MNQILDERRDHSGKRLRRHDVGQMNVHIARGRHRRKYFSQHHVRNETGSLGTRRNHSKSRESNVKVKKKNTAMGRNRTRKKRNEN